jgi:hypothetical protein
MPYKKRFFKDNAKISKINCGLIVFIFCATANAQPSSETIIKWNGNYSFSSNAGHTVGGSFISYRLKLMLSPSGSCKLEEDEFQLVSRIDCEVSQSGNGIDIIFKNFSKNNIYGSEYKPGDKLFSLYPKGKSLITVWKNLYPEDFAKHKKGIYIKRKGDNHE